MQTTLSREAVTRDRQARFAQVAITSVFGDPRAPRTWSGAPANLANALERLGVTVKGIGPRLGKITKACVALGDIAAGRGVPINGEQILRSHAARRLLARQVAAEAARLGVRDILHTGTFDLGGVTHAGDGGRHYLYCDHTWALARRHHAQAARYTGRALRSFEQAERQSLQAVEHVFTFGAYVRENLIDHYGLAPERVSAVGSGMGNIAPWRGAKDYAAPRLLFVAKHLFREKGGVLLLEAFRRVRALRNDLSLTIVGDERSRSFIEQQPGVELHAHLPWKDLEQLYRRSTLLVQPMLNDPWGQVYLEAMVSRTPVMGLARNGLPELVGQGDHGFLVERDDPDILAAAILGALSDPARLSRMAAVAQQHVLDTYSWDRVAEKILFH